MQRETELADLRGLLPPQGGVFDKSPGSGVSVVGEPLRRWHAAFVASAKRFKSRTQNERPVPAGDGRECAEWSETRKSSLFHNPTAGTRRFEPNRTALPPMAVGNRQKASRPAFVAPPATSHRPNGFFQTVRHATTRSRRGWLAARRLTATGRSPRRRYGTNAQACGPFFLAGLCVLGKTPRGAAEQASWETRGRPVTLGRLPPNCRRDTPPSARRR